MINELTLIVDNPTNDLIKHILILDPLTTEVTRVKQCFSRKWLFWQTHRSHPAIFGSFSKPFPFISPKNLSTVLQFDKTFLLLPNKEWENP